MSFLSPTLTLLEIIEMRMLVQQTLYPWNHHSNPNCFTFKSFKFYIKYSFKTNQMLKYMAILYWLSNLYWFHEYLCMPFWSTSRKIINCCYGECGFGACYSEIAFTINFFEMKETSGILSSVLEICWENWEDILKFYYSIFYFTYSYLKMII